MSRPPVTCPGCDGQMTRGAKTCAGCRQRGLSIGLEAVLEYGPRVQRLSDLPRLVDSAPITPGQIRGFYGKTSALSKLTGLDADDLHDEALAAASERFGRKIASVKDLDELEAHWTLDHLQARIREARHVGVDDQDEDEEP